MHVAPAYPIPHLRWWAAKKHADMILIRKAALSSTALYMYIINACHSNICVCIGDVPGTL
jgi:hypothetical protein